VTASHAIKNQSRAERKTEVAAVRKKSGELSKGPNKGSEKRGKRVILPWMHLDNLQQSRKKKQRGKAHSVVAMNLYRR